ncbi:MAG: pseudaminic acid biosynthesis-associated methylase [Candidatus Endolissoclinum sp. TMED37]|nr:MAG: pseudaminic acid biosynthesis-associated methylase [Candidatus Endolissoclinum sp. TMED37]|tara:strand:+ start:4509 stop:5129 length:621 start_codon:yes stop_codon:yes gene_type:complete
MTFQTEQETFWAENFGDAYIDRNNSEELIVRRMVNFSTMLKSTQNIKSIAELGSNIGLNSIALKRLNKKFSLIGYEINKKAVEIANTQEVGQFFCESVINPINVSSKFDLAFTSGVLIHINPDFLENVYENLYNLSSRYIIINEYYNPTPTSVVYRGAEGKIFKRDFAGELMDKYDLNLVDYGFLYRRDNYFPRDDTNWFLLEKNK